MSKKEVKITDTELIEDESKITVSSSDIIPIWKYISLYRPEMPIYIRAFIEDRFRDIMKTKEEWNSEIKKELEVRK